MDALKELGWRELERVAPFPGLTDANTEPRLYIPGGGITKGLYTDRYRERKIAVSACWITIEAIVRSSKQLFLYTSN